MDGTQVHSENHDYRVQLDIYNGPLDLLLYLIRRDEVDIHDIPIATITTQYLSYVEVIKQVDIDLAGDFLVMAATLLEIKSAMLLPREEKVEGEQGEEDLSDPRLQLVRQLLEYKKFKDIAGHLDDVAGDQANRFPRSQADIHRVRKESRHEQELDLDSLQIWDLFDAFNHIVKTMMLNQRQHEVFSDDTPIDVYEVDILDRAQKQQPMTFRQVFEGKKTKIEMVGMFLAMLELMRQKLIRIEQEKTFGEIYLFALTTVPADMAVAKAVSADIANLPSDLNPDHTDREGDGQAGEVEKKEGEVDGDAAVMAGAGEAAVEAEAGKDDAAVMAESEDMGDVSDVDDGEMNEAEQDETRLGDTVLDDTVSGLENTVLSDDGDDENENGDIQR